MPSRVGLAVLALVGKSQGRKISEAKIATAMTWSEPSRDVGIARESQ